MKDLTYIQLLNRIAKEGSAVKVFQEITREYAEGVEEPKEYQWVRDRVPLINTPYWKTVLRELKIPLTPPSPKRPGVGVVMWNLTGPGSYIITKVDELLTHIIYSDGGVDALPHEDLDSDRHATDEEITELFGGLDTSS